MSSKTRFAVALAGPALLLACFSACGPATEGDGAPPTQRGTDGPTDPTKPLRVSGTLLARCLGHKDSVTSVSSVAISPDGKLAVSGGNGPTLRFWSIPDGTQVRTVQIDPLEGDAGWAGAATFSPDGKLAAALALWYAAHRPPNAPPAHRLYFWEADTLKEVQLRIPIARSIDLAYSPDGAKVAVAGEGVQVWDLRLRKKLHDFQYPETVVGRGERVVFSPDGKLLAAGFSHGQPFGKPVIDEPPSAVVRVWDLNSGKELLALTGPRNANAIAISPDGELLAAGGEERGGNRGVVHLWNLRTGHLIRSWKADPYLLFCLAFSPGGKLLASGGDDPAVKLWDVATGQLAGTLEGHSDQIHALTFARDGRTLASAGSDKQVLLWRLKWK
ncbi:MAG: hypothetical protein HYS12_00165 [Planctomycetes bacterium]|nr:hypothetical protein [Planctomycetota bacterium]